MRAALALRRFGGAEADETFEEWLEEAEEAERAMELFDVMECLARPGALLERRAAGERGGVCGGRLGGGRDVGP